MRLPWFVLLTTLSLAPGPSWAQPEGRAWDEFQDRQSALSALGDIPPSQAKVLSDSIFTDGFEPESRDEDPCQADTDADRLADCLENGSGVYRGASDPGTDPLRRDTDADGINDGDEVMVTLTGLDLQAFGVNPLRRDLLVEYDWIEDQEVCDFPHSHKPTEAVMERLRVLYASAPITNPDGSRGINFIQDAGQGGVFTGGNQVHGYPHRMPGFFDATYEALRVDNQDERRRGFFRYMLFTHSYNNGSNSSGYGEVVGDDTMVTLQCYTSENNTVRTIAHEMGHNLGLHHGGFEACNQKPNYNSLMNYRYQFAGLDTQCHGSGDGQTDGYSTGTRHQLDENALSEINGMCGGPAIDWNRNGAIDPLYITADINPGNANTCGTDIGRITDFDDWGNLTFMGIREADDRVKRWQRFATCPGAAPEPFTWGKPAKSG
jgi:hypothetical protein